MQKTSSKQLIFIFLVVMIDVTGMSLIIPVMPQIIAQLTNDSPAHAAVHSGWMEMAFAGAMFLFSPLLGALSDRFGRKPILLIALAGLGINYIFHAFAPSIGWLYASRILAGGFGASYAVANSYIADISTKEQRAANFGVIGAAFGVGFIIGPVIGGYFSQWGVALPFLIAAGLSLLNMVYGIVAIPESLPREKRRKLRLSACNPIGALAHIFRLPKLFTLMSGFFLVHLAGMSLHATWTFFAIDRFDWEPIHIGISLGYVGILLTLTNLFLIKPMKKWVGTRHTILIGLLMSIIGLIAFGASQQSWHLYVSIFPYCLGAVAIPVLQGILSNQVSDTEQGELQGGISSLTSLSAIIGPVLWTQLFDFTAQFHGTFLHSGSVFYASSIVLVFAFLVLTIGLKRKSLKS